MASGRRAVWVTNLGCRAGSGKRVANAGLDTSAARKMAANGAISKASADVCGGQRDVFWYRGRCLIIATSSADKAVGIQQ